MANILAIAGSNSRYKRTGSQPAGFFAGLWHGLVTPFVFWISLFVNGVRIYETNNKGRRYDFGFLLGLGAWASHSEVREVIQTTSVLEVTRLV